MGHVFMFDTRVHVTECIVTHVARQRCLQAVSFVIMGDGLVVLLELGLAVQAVVRGRK